MPVYLLTSELVFPPPEGASREGVVAVGGDFRPERLILAYSQGIFPWPTERMPLLWFSPDPRFVLEPTRAHVPRSLAKTARKTDLIVKADTAFEEVVRRCAEVPREGQDGTWIVEPLIEGYVELHRLGFAHSIECWRGDTLVGGLYGVSLGRAFFGESMFALEPDASKLAFGTLLGNLIAWNFAFVDCQVPTAHLERFGAEEWRRSRYLRELRSALEVETRKGAWVLPLSIKEAFAKLAQATQAP